MYSEHFKSKHFNSNLVFQLHLNIVAEKNSLKMRPSICVYQALQVILVDAEA